MMNVGAAVVCCDGMTLMPGVGCSDAGADCMLLNGLATGTGACWTAGVWMLLNGFAVGTGACWTAGVWMLLNGLAAATGTTLLGLMLLEATPTATLLGPTSPSTITYHCQLVGRGRH